MELWTGALSWWKCHWPDGISSWTPLKTQHSNSNPNPLANQLWCIDFLTPPTPPIIPYRLPTFLESLMPLKNWCSIHERCSKNSLKRSIRFCGIFPSLKQNFIAYRSSKVSSRPDCIFEIQPLNSLMVMFQWCWRFGEYRPRLQVYCSQVHSMGKIELNCVLILNWIVWIRTDRLNRISWNRNVCDKLFK